MDRAISFCTHTMHTDERPYTNLDDDDDDDDDGEEEEVKEAMSERKRFSSSVDVFSYGK